MGNLHPTSPLLSPTPIDMLFLSGGGSHGAYGAGVLYSWSSGGAHPPPAVVTGVSAGALQSTWAFLGEPYNDAMYRNYTRLQDDDVYKTRPLIALLWSPSAATADGLKKIIDEAITDDVIRLVGKQDGKRLLCVGTVNLDTGRFVTWNMTAIAAAEQFDRGWSSSPPRYSQKSRRIGSPAIPLPRTTAHIS
jgi:predicted acylesterase/phospholipase RssA